jgi:hypothetical protein
MKPFHAGRIAVLIVLLLVLMVLAIAVGSLAEAYATDPHWMRYLLG